MYNILYLLLILIIILGMLEMYVRSRDPPKKNICTGNLTDLEYLNHMIPHHQVAVDISIELQKKTNSPAMQDILRKLIWVQKYEIDLMQELKKTIYSEDGMSVQNNMNKTYIYTVSDFVYPNKKGLTHTYCDPHFFDPEKHMEHIKHMDLTDEMYIHHMIPHHQVAVDMSKVLLTNTKNDFMIYLAYRIIRSQQEEIVLLNDLLNSKLYQSSHQSMSLARQ